MGVPGSILGRATMIVLADIPTSSYIFDGKTWYVHSSLGESIQLQIQDYKDRFIIFKPITYQGEHDFKPVGIRAYSLMSAWAFGLLYAQVVQDGDVLHLSLYY